LVEALGIIALVALFACLVVGLLAAVVKSFDRWFRWWKD
jgi:hypothetical protein